MKKKELEKLAAALELAGFEVVELTNHSIPAVDGKYAPQETGDLLVRITPVKEEK